MIEPILDADKSQHNDIQMTEVSGSNTYSPESEFINSKETTEDDEVSVSHTNSPESEFNDSKQTTEDGLSKTETKPIIPIFTIPLEKELDVVGNAWQFYKSESDQVSGSSEQMDQKPITGMINVSNIKSEYYCELDDSELFPSPIQDLQDNEEFMVNKGQRRPEVTEQRPFREITDISPDGVGSIESETCGIKLEAPESLSVNIESWNDECITPVESEPRFISQNSKRCNNPNTDTMSMESNHKSCHSGARQRATRVLKNKSDSSGSGNYAKKFKKAGPVFGCAICCAKFVKPQQLLEHLRRKHLSAKTLAFQCVLCRKRFSVMRKLQGHVYNSACDKNKAHNQLTAKPPDLCYGCGICQANFSQFESLSDHMQEEHPYAKTLSFQCLECKKFFPAESKIKTHAEKNHKVFQCPICFDWFTRLALHKHLIITGPNISCQRYGIPNMNSSDTPIKHKSSTRGSGGVIKLENISKNDVFSISDTHKSDETKQSDLTQVARCFECDRWIIGKESAIKHRSVCRMLKMLNVEKCHNCDKLLHGTKEIEEHRHLCPSSASRENERDCYKKVYITKSSHRRKRSLSSINVGEKLPKWEDKEDPTNAVDCSYQEQEVIKQENMFKEVNRNTVAEQPNKTSGLESVSKKQSDVTDEWHSSSASFGISLQNCKKYTDEKEMPVKSVCCMHCNTLIHEELFVIHFFNSHICGNETTTEQGIETKVPTTFQCKKCAFPHEQPVHFTAEQLKHHISVQHDIKAHVYKCNICNCATSEFQILLTHVHMCHPESNQELCVLCNQTYPSMIMSDHKLDSHELMMCYLCNSDVHPFDWGNHMITIHRVKTYHCGICLSTFTEISALRKHMEFDNKMRRQQNEEKLLVKQRESRERKKEREKAYRRVKAKKLEEKRKITNAKKSEDSKCGVSPIRHLHSEKIMVVVKEKRTAEAQQTRSFTCNACRIIFPDRRKLLEHPCHPFTCDNCRVCFPTKMDLNHHLGGENGKCNKQILNAFNSIYCVSCNRNFISQHDVQEHKQTGCDGKIVVKVVKPVFQVVPTPHQQPNPTSPTGISK